MEKLITTQIANEVGVSVYTLKRWYRWWKNEDVNKLNELVKNGMPELPAYQKVGNSNWKMWNREDIEQLKKFKEYLPKTRNGFMHSCENKKKEEK